MTDRQKLTTEMFLATNVALIEGLKARVLAMQAENSAREQNHSEPAYGAEVFAQAAFQFANIATKLNQTYQALEQMKD